MQLSILTLTLVAAIGLTQANEEYIFKLGNIVIPRRQAGQTNAYVAFSAGLTHDINLAGNTSVPFDKVYLNNGNGYSNTTGVFTCPTTGLYTFIYHGLSESAGQMWLDLYHNNEYVVTGYAHNANDYASASNAVTLQLTAGDTVYIRGHGSNQLYGRTDEIYATFSGFQLFGSYHQ